MTVPRPRGLGRVGSVVLLGLLAALVAPVSGSPAAAQVPATQALVVDVVSQPGSAAVRVSTPGAQPRRFWVADRHRYASRWYAGRHRKMVGFGCTRAPYYDPSPLCRGDRGFHHGLDIAMRCGTRLYAGFRGTVVRPGSPGSLGDAYGPYAFRLRNQRLHKDFVIGHVLRVYVRPGDHVARGQLIARASDQGAPDGCHLHFEVRPRAGSYTEAINPRRFIRLHRPG